MNSLNYVSETKALRRVANDRDCRFKFTNHALDEMAADKVTAPDVEYVLMNGQVTLIEWKKDILWRVIGNDLDGRKIELVVAVYENILMIKVVTVF